MGHVVEHEGIGGERGAGEVLRADGGEFLLEEFAGHRTGILEVTQTLVSEEGQVAIGHDGFEKPLPAISFGMLLAGKPAEKVRCGVVKNIRNEMVTDADIRFAGFSDKGRSRAIEGERHEKVTRFGAKMSHTRIIVSSFAIVAMLAARLIRRTERMRHHTSIRIEESAFSVTPEHPAANEIRRYLFATVA